MQGEYFGGYQTLPQGYPVAPSQVAAAAAAAVGCYQPQYGYQPQYATVLPTNRNLEKLKRSKNKLNGKLDDAANVSTDESIHLVRARKTGESAVSRYDSQKKRSQSGNSLMKGGANNTIERTQQLNRSHSDERTASGNGSETASNRGKNKKKKDKKNRRVNQWGYEEQEQQSVYPDNSYYYQNQQYQQQQQQQQQYPQQYLENQYPVATETWNMEYNAPMHQQYGYQDPNYFGGQWPCYDQAPGAPVNYYHSQVQVQQPQQAYDPYHQQQQQQYYQQQPQQQQYAAAGPAISCNQPNYAASQTMYAPQPGYDQQANSANVPGLPPGAKLVAEYFLGYIDNQNAYPAHQQQQQPQIIECECPESSSSESSKDVDVEIWEKKDDDDDRSERDESREKVREEKKDKRAPSNNSRPHSSKPENLQQIKDDLVNLIQKQFENLNLKGGKDALQPIFLMPKCPEGGAGGTKQVFIPRNVYVPVIRPVFVPRERIIVRPQIIHVARPVLVDRPVPIQQRPIVIERDRPVPVRVETIERTEPSGVVGGSCDVSRSVENTQEVTYHEFTQNYQSQAGSSQSGGGGVGVGASSEYSASNYQYGNDQYDDNRRKQEVLEILEEAERRKKNLESKSNENLVAQYKYVKYDAGADNVKALDSMLGNTQGYTLEVLDQRVSDKFEKTDQETIKARYGVDSFQYLPAGVEITNRSNDYQSIGSSNSYKNLASDNNNRASNSSTNIYASYSGASASVNLGDTSTPYGTVTNVAQIPSPGSRVSSGQAQSQAPVVIQNVQKMVQNFGYSVDQ